MNARHTPVRADGLPIDGLPEGFTGDMVPVWWNGHEFGLHEGYGDGWRWGFLWGVLAGAALAFAAVRLGFWLLQ